MSRRRAIILGYIITFIFAVFIIICTYTCTSKAQEVDDKEAVMIDGHAIEVVYGDDGTPYLKYVIAKENIYIPLPTEPDTATDSLQFYYTKNHQNERRF